MEKEIEIRCGSLVQLKSNPKEMFSVREITSWGIAVLLRINGSKETVQISEIELIEDINAHYELQRKFDELFGGNSH